MSRYVLDFIEMVFYILSSITMVLHYHKKCAKAQRIDHPVASDLPINDSEDLHNSSSSSS